MNPQQTYEKAIRLHQTGRFGKAIKLYKELIRLFPNQDALHSNLGSALASLGKRGEAELHFEKAIRLNNHNADAYAGLGSLYSMQNRPEKAIRSFLSALRVSPRNSNIHFNLANVYIKTDRLEKAESALENAIRYNPRFVQAYFNLGTVHYRNQKTEAAKQAFYKTIELKKDFEGAYLNLAYLFMDEGKLTEAEAVFKRGLVHLPENPKLLCGLGRIKIEFGAYQTAIDLLTKSHEKAPDSLETLTLLGNACKENGQREQAKMFYRKALEIEPQNEGVLQNLSRMESREIPGWHFTMLADELRNSAYENALKKVVKGKKVLEIGAGSGLLSLMAAKYGAERVTACEMIKSLAETAEKIVKDNGYEEKIDVIPKKSTDLLIGQDMDEKADVLVAEIFDVALLGEMVLPTFRHAKAHLLSENVLIIPYRATVWAILVEMPKRRKVNPLRTISGFDLSAFNRYRVPNEYISVHLSAEVYTPLSEPFEVLSIDFNAIFPGIPDDRPESKSMQVNAIQAGTVQAVVFWFDLFLDDEIKVSSGKDGEMKHWGQAAHFIREDIEVEKGETLPVRVLYTDNFIRFEIEGSS